MSLMEKRFGTIAVEKAFINKDQLLEAMRIQVNENIAGKDHMPIGSILMKLKYVTETQVNEVLLSLRRE